MNHHLFSSNMHMKNFLGANAEYNLDLCDFFKSKIGDDSSSVYRMVKCLDVSLPKISSPPNPECINSHTSEEGPLCVPTVWCLHS